MITDQRKLWTSHLYISRVLSRMLSICAQKFSGRFVYRRVFQEALGLRSAAALTAVAGHTWRVWVIYRSQLFSAALLLERQGLLQHGEEPWNNSCSRWPQLLPQFGWPQLLPQFGTPCQNGVRHSACVGLDRWGLDRWGVPQGHLSVANKE